jgi:hypothetical protein
VYLAGVVLHSEGCVEVLDNVRDGVGEEIGAVNRGEECGRCCEVDVRSQVSECGRDGSTPVVLGS